MNKNKLGFLIPLGIIVILAAIYPTGLYEDPEHLVYNLFLRIKPEIKEDESILLVNIDDLAISKVGMFPWPRDIMADGLVLLKEFDASYAVFDIEYTEASLRGLNPDILKIEVPYRFDSEFGSLRSNLQDLLDAIAAGAIPPAHIPLYSEEVLNLTVDTENRLKQTVSRIERDNDEYLGQAARYFGDTFFTIGMLPDEDDDISPEVKEWTRLRRSLQALEIEKSSSIKSAVDIRPSIFPIITRGLSAGFVNIVVDTDGMRRRIDLVMEENGNYFPQLAFSAALELLGNPAIGMSGRAVTLKKARIPGKTPADIRIPLAEDHTMLINWPKKEFEESFRHLSFYYLVLHSRQERDLIDNLRAMEGAGYLDYYQGDAPLMDYYDYGRSLKEQMLAGKSPESMEEYREVRSFFFSELEAFLNSGIDASLEDEINTLLQQNTFPEETVAELEGIREDIRSFFSASRSISGNLKRTREILQREVPGSLCIIGWTGTSTIDRGVTPFDESYDNVGTHAAIINTILQEEFLDDLPWWYGVVLGLLFSMVVYFITRRLSPVWSTVVGIIFILLYISASIMLFLFAGIYLPLMIAVLSISGTFIILTILNLIFTAKEKTYIRSAFGHYLSDTVVSELLNDPEKLTLGGEKKHITAAFTDVKGFSTISEQLTPTELVTLLNLYLSQMSDIILDLGGTIDKYEGDAIIAFFGAPVDLKDHASRACRAAIQMKKTEARLNTRFLEDQLAPGPLLTRIGINTGDMVVGNMGTARKMDYTIMGNAVNLAARLEGVNKQYGTWILTSEITKENAGDDFAFRMLDRVRVVGINEPVRLYQVVDETKYLEAEMGKAISSFHAGIERFENKEWDGAIEAFTQVLNLIPGDGPAETFLKRCREYKENPPPEGWDGVFNLTSK